MNQLLGRAVAVAAVRGAVNRVAELRGSPLVEAHH